MKEAAAHAAAILAGGESSRFGADKAMADLGGEPMIAHVARALRGAVRIAVVGNARAATSLAAGDLCDPANAVRGPLAGVLAGLEWGEALGVSWLATAPCDAPLLPSDVAEHLIAAAEEAGVSAAFAATASGLHPLCAAWRPALAAPLRDFFSRGVHPPVRELVPDAARVMFDDEEAFLNVNTRQDMARALARLARDLDGAR